MTSRIGGERESIARHPVAQSMLGAGGLAPGIAKKVERYQGEGPRINNDGKQLDAAHNSSGGRFRQATTSGVTPLAYVDSIPGSGLTVKPPEPSRTSPIIDVKA